MDKIHEAIIDILAHPTKWNYYDSEELRKKIVETKDINNSEHCYDFIKEYIKLSDKGYYFIEEALDFFKINEKNYDQRLCHIVSSFFLGLALYNHESGYFSEAIRNELCALGVFDSADDIDHEFIFVWFLVCMFHDLGYVYESLLGKDYVDTEFLKSRYCNEAKQLVEALPDFKGECAKLPKTTIPIHYEMIIENYLEYRQNKDHGILGGLSFATKLTKLRKQKYEGDTGNLSWKPELDKLYNYVGWRICCHNIWYQRGCESSNSGLIDYANAGLSSLILDNKKEKNGTYKKYPINFKKHPLFFFFCLIDTIEPTKKCDGKIPDDMELDLIDGVLEISCTSEKKYINDISKSLNEWLAGTIINENKMTIYLDKKND